MGAIWKAHSRILLMGFVISAPFLFLLLILNWLWSIFATIKIVNYPILNFLLISVGILAFSYVVGLLTKWGWSRVLILFLVSKIPIIGSWAQALLNREFMEKLREQGLLEVMFPDVGDRWGFGIATKEILRPVHPRDWAEYVKNPSAWTLPLIEWCVVLGPPTAPVAPTAPMWYCKKSQLVYNGSTAKDTLLTAASFGFSLQSFGEKGKQ